jgi:hypothetical protein
VVSLVTLKSLAGLISKHINPVPTAIFTLFQSIIESRKETYQLFLEITASDPDPPVSTSNESHKIWIDGLIEAFHALGGESWLPGNTGESNISDEDKEQVIFSNKFSTLSLDGDKDVDGDDDEDEDADNAMPTAIPIKERANVDENRRQSENKK